MTTDDEYEWTETTGPLDPPKGPNWELVSAKPTKTGVTVARWRRKPLGDALRAQATALIEKWRRELRDYPASTEGRYAAATVAGCIKELRAVLERTR